MKQQIKEQLQLAAATALTQAFAGLKIFGYEIITESRAYTLVGLKSLWHHIRAERRRMTRELWFSVLWKYNWECLRCHVRNYRNQEPGKAKIEVDHVQALAKWGLTILANLQTLCKPCNQWKATRTIDYRVL